MFKVLCHITAKLPLHLEILYLSNIRQSFMNLYFIVVVFNFLNLHFVQGLIYTCVFISSSTAVKQAETQRVETDSLLIDSCKFDS